MPTDDVERVPLRVFEVRFSVYFLPPPTHVLKVRICNYYTGSSTDFSQKKQKKTGR